MFYPQPHKVQLAATQAKWQPDSTQSLLFISGLNELKQQSGWQNSDLSVNIASVLCKAQALDIPVLYLDIQPENQMQNMIHLAEMLSSRQQLMLCGWISPQIRQLIQHISTVTDHICIVHDAVHFQQPEQHIQAIETAVSRGLHHMGSQTLSRLWSLSAPAEQVLSTRGILLAIAEQLNMDAMEIQPDTDLRHYGLDSVSMVSLTGLWRANGADLTYEDFLQNCTVQQIVQKLQGTF